jgi:hypothetical protein
MRSARSDFALVRCDTEGVLDPTFGDDGKVTTTWAELKLPAR